MMAPVTKLARIPRTIQKLELHDGRGIAGILRCPILFFECVNVASQYQATPVKVISPNFEFPDFHPCSELDRHTPAP
jgi:hypothetical protein